MFKDPSEAAGYLSALIDGEGSISLSPGSNGRIWGTRHVVVTNTDYALIEAMQEACVLLGVDCRVNGPYLKQDRKPHWRVHIQRWAALERLAEVVNLRSEKALTLRALLGSYQYARKLPREQLEQMYVFQGLDTYQIARTPP